MRGLHAGGGRPTEASAAFCGRPLTRRAGLPQVKVSIAGDAALVAESAAKATAGAEAHRPVALLAVFTTLAIFLRAAVPRLRC